MATLREEILQLMHDLRRCGGEGQTYAGGYADAHHEIADTIEETLKRTEHPTAGKPRKWEREIVASLSARGEPMRLSEIINDILGVEPHKKKLALQGACILACKRRVITRLGTSAVSYRYVLPQSVAAVDPQGSDAVAEGRPRAGESSS